MEESRRGILWLALGMLLLTITGRTTPAPGVDSASTYYPAPSRRMRAIKSSKTPAKKAKKSPAKKAPAPSAPKPTAPKPGAGVTYPWFKGDASLKVLPRTQWADARPLMDRMDPMGRVDRITLHHEGWNPVAFTDLPTTAERLELIRRSHINRLHSGDIGYHFVIDRAGRVWQAREARYQGAHVRSNNENNIGVMCLGNFDVQSPSPEQLKSLVATVKALRRFYKVPVYKVKTHREINPTACPGKNLQAFIVQARKNKSFA
jgi:hypothetical protein